MSECCDILFNLFSPAGQVVVAGAGDFLSLDYQRSENEVGAFEIVLPPHYRSLDIGPDWIFEFYRVVDGQPQLDGETCWFARRFEELYTDSQCGAIVIGGHDTMGLLKRRIVAWFAPDNTDPGVTGEGYKTRPADLAIREIFQENFGSLTTAGTPPPSVTAPAGFPGPTSYNEASRQMSIEEDTGAGSGPVVVQDIAWKNALEAMQSFASASAQQDETQRVLFDVLYTPSGSGVLGEFEFRVWNGSRGVDRTGVLFSPEYGNLLNARLIRDFTDECTWVHVGGTGSGTARVVAGVADQGRERSQWYPIECFLDLNQQETNAQEALVGAGQAHLNTHRGDVSLSGDVVQELFLFGRDYFFGDSVQGQAGGFKFLSRISNFGVHVEGGECRISIDFKSDRYVPGEVE